MPPLIITKVKVFLIRRHIQYSSVHCWQSSCFFFIVSFWDKAYENLLSYYNLNFTLKLLHSWPVLHFISLTVHDRLGVITPMTLTLVMMRGGTLCPPQSVFIFKPKISPPDQSLRPTCKFLILGLLYHDFFFFWKFSI